MRRCVLFGDGDVIAMDEEPPRHEQDWHSCQGSGNNFKAKFRVDLVETIGQCHFRNSYTFVHVVFVVILGQPVVVQSLNSLHFLQTVGHWGDGLFESHICNVITIIYTNYQLYLFPSPLKQG